MATIEATIPVAGTETNIVSIADDEILGIIFPTLSTTNITFETAGSNEDTFVPIQKSDLSGAYTITGTDGDIAVWTPELAPFERLKIVSSAAQGAGAVIKIIVRKGKS